MTRRLILTLLLFLLIMGASNHWFLSADNTSHVTQESNCSIHSVIAQHEQAQTFTQTPATAITQIRDSTRAFNLSAKISHPPTF